MDLFDILSLIGGLALFLFGMDLMKSALEKRAGGRLKAILSNITSNPFKGFLLGLGVTSVIQSSSATTVMVVGFVNSGLMTLKQSVSVIMGANLGASLISWITALAGIQGENFVLQLLKPSSFVPVMALIGMVLVMFQKSPKRKDTGMILMGFSVLMFGMEFMSGAVSGLSDMPEFTRILTVFSNPVVGVLVGTVFTAIIQSSGASVAILQVLSMTGGMTFATVVPVVMGQNIGTCITAMISSVGASKNAKRAAVIHLSFNVIATLIILPLYYLYSALFPNPLESMTATPFGIAMVHTAFKLIALAILIPASGWLEKLARLVVRDSKRNGETQLLDERLMATPSVAIARCREVMASMAELSVCSMQVAVSLLDEYTEKTADRVREMENEVDTYEDKLGSYLVKLSAHEMSEGDSREANKFLHVLSDFERISDHAVNVVRSAEEIHEKKLEFSGDAKKELSVMVGAISEILDLSLAAFESDDLDSAVMVEPLEQVVDHLRDVLKKQHVKRLQKQECTIELGFVLSDLLTTFERVSDHCSNIAACILELTRDELDVHEYLRGVKGGDTKEFNDYFDYFKVKYSLE